MSIRLSARLAAIAQAVPQNARLIDVGTDHAMLPVWLVQTGKIFHAWASDINPGPLQSAARLISETETEAHISLRLTDGLNGFSANDGDAIVIAGMGGETMVEILRDAPWTKNAVTLILEPQTKQEILRRFLCENGYVVFREYLTADAGRLYPILLARGGLSPAYSEAELYTGLLSQIAGDPLFPAYLEKLIKRAASAAPYEAEAKKLLAAYLTMKEGLKS